MFCSMGHSINTIIVYCDKITIQYILFFYQLLLLFNDLHRHFYMVKTPFTRNMSDCLASNVLLYRFYLKKITHWSPECFCNFPTIKLKAGGGKFFHRTAGAVKNGRGSAATLFSSSCSLHCQTEQDKKDQLDQTKRCWTGQY